LRSTIPGEARKNFGGAPWSRCQIEEVGRSKQRPNVDVEENEQQTNNARILVMCAALFDKLSMQMEGDAAWMQDKQLSRWQR
jgi:hypothetical protein